MNKFGSYDAFIVAGIFLISCAVLVIISQIFKVVRSTLEVKKEVKCIKGTFENLLTAIGINIEFAMRIDDTIITLIHTDPYNKYIAEKGMADKFKTVRDKTDEYRAFLNNTIAEIIDTKIDISYMTDNNYDEVMTKSWKTFDYIADRVQKYNVDLLPYARELRDAVKEISGEHDDDEFLRAMTFRFKGV
jgi:hypothetical protein